MMRLTGTSALQGGEHISQPEFNAAVEDLARVLVPLSVAERSAVVNAALDLAVRADREADGEARLRGAMTR